MNLLSEIETMINFSLCAQWVAKDPSFLHTGSEDFDQTGRDAQADLSLRCALNGWIRTQAFFTRTAKTLIRLGGCPG